MVPGKSLSLSKNYEFCFRETLIHKMSNRMRNLHMQYWILFPIENLRQAVDTAKRILTKEKLDKQLTGQTSTSPFMSIKEGTERRVSFNNRDELGDKIDKLTVMMGRLVAKDTHEKRPLKPQIYKSRGWHRSYGQGNYQSRSGSRNMGTIYE